MYVHGNYVSEVLGGKRNYLAIIPNQPNEKTRVLFLLHGFGTDELEWSCNTPLVDWTEQFNVAFFCPTGGNNFYTDHANGEYYGKALGEEFRNLMQQFYRLNFAKENTAIAGFSMGGYGAIRLGLAYPEYYSFIGGFSPAFVFYKRKRNNPNFNLVFSKGLEDTENDCLYLYKQLLKEGSQLAPIRLACGEDDPLDVYTQEFYQGVLRLDAKADITYVQQPGFHDFGLWSKDLLRFLNEWTKNVEVK